MSYDDNLLIDAVRELQQQFGSGVYQPRVVPAVAAGTAVSFPVSSYAEIEQAREKIKKPVIRIGDTERDKAISALSVHFAAGRLWESEFSERSEKAVRAETQQELDKLTADLPQPAGEETARKARHDFMSSYWYGHVVTALLVLCAFTILVMAAIT